MNPRDFLGFLKTKSGRLLVFVCLFALALIVLMVLRGGKSGQHADLEPVITRGSPSDKPQVASSIERPMEAFRPPAQKPAKVPFPSGTPSTVTNEASGPRHSAPPSEPLAPISLFADTTAGTVEPKGLGSIFAPFGRLIPCETVITVDSASMQTPIVGLVTEDVYHAGKLVIPAGTEVHGMAQTDRHRERIASSGSWTLVWQTGEELRLRGIALDREFSGNQEGWGITDGSAGLRGRIIKSDNLAEIKLFAASFLSGAAQALEQKSQTIYGPVNSPTLGNAPFQGAEQVLGTYAQQIYDTIQRDGFYVRVSSGKQFYLYVPQTIDRSDASIGGSMRPFAGDETTNLPPVALAPPVQTPPSFKSRHPSDL